MVVRADQLSSFNVPRTMCASLMSFLTDLLQWQDSSTPRNAFPLFDNIHLH